MKLSDQSERDQVQLLASMHGGRDVIARAREFADVPGVGALMDDLEAVLASCDRNGNVNVYIDLTEAWLVTTPAWIALYARGSLRRLPKVVVTTVLAKPGRSRPATGVCD